MPNNHPEENNPHGDLHIEKNKKTPTDNAHGDEHIETAARSTHKASSSAPKLNEGDNGVYVRREPKKSSYNRYGFLTATREAAPENDAHDALRSKL